MSVNELAQDLMASRTQFNHPLGHVDDAGSSALWPEDTIGIRDSRARKIKRRKDEQRLIDYTAQILALSRSHVIVEFHVDGTIITANDLFLRHFSYTREELVGQNHDILVPADTPSVDAFARALHDGIEQVCEFQRKKKDNTVLLLRGAYYPLQDAVGNVFKVVLIATPLADTADEPPQATDPRHRVDACSLPRAVLDNILSAKRLDALHHYRILDTPAEEDFDDIAKLASLISGRPMALVSLVDRDRQWFKSRRGVEATETPVNISFCAYAIQHNDVFEVPDAHQDSRFRDSPLVTGEPRIRSYAGAPLITPAGERIGSLCVMDHVPGSLDALQRVGLRLLAVQVVRALETNLATEILKSQSDFHRTLLASAGDAIVSTGPQGKIVSFNPAAERLTGWKAHEVVATKTLDDFRIAEEMDASLAAAVQEFGSPLSTPFEALVAMARGNAPGTSEWTLLRKDGGQIAVHATVTAIRDDNEMLTGFLFVLRDNTVHQNVLELLRRNNRALEAADEHTRHGSWSLEMESGETHWSRAMYGIYGVPVGQPISLRNFLDPIHPDDRDYLKENLCGWMFKAKPVEWEHRIEVNGAIKWVRMTARCKPGCEGTPRIAFGAIQDITEIRERKERVNANRKLAGCASCLAALESRHEQSA